LAGINIKQGEKINYNFYPENLFTIEQVQQMTSESNSIDALRLKIIVRQNCLNFGAVETAKKLSKSPEKLEVLLQLLISEDLADSAYLLARNFLSKEAFEAFSQKPELADVEKESVKVSQVTGNLHYKLTGETLLETRKKLRAERKAADKAKAQDKKEDAKKAPAKEKSSKTKKKASKAKPSAKEGNKSAKPAPVKTPKVKEVPTHDKNGLEYLSLAEFEFKRENYFFVPTQRSFAKVKDHFLGQKTIGFDVEYYQGNISTIALASTSTLAVIDFHALKDTKEVTQYIVDLLQNDKIDKITHTFRMDSYLLSKVLEIDPTSIAKVIDISDTIKEEGSDNRVGLKAMVEKYFKKALNQYYKKSNWSDRPIEQPLIDYAALNAYIILKTFNAYETESKDKGIQYYTYEEPKNIPRVGKWEVETKEKKVAEKKTEAKSAPRKPAHEKETEAGDAEE
jgi:hypothetical protein